MKLNTKKFLMLISSIFLFITNSFIAISVLLGLTNFETDTTALSISNDVQVIFLSICAISNLISIILILKNLLKHKKKIIIFNILQIFFGSLINITVGIFNIVLISTKTKDIEEVQKEKKRLPELDDITKYKWYVYLLIFTFLFVFLYTPVSELIPTPNTRTSALINLTLLYLIQILFLVIPMLDEIKRDFIMFKNNFKIYTYNIFPRFGLIIIIYMITNFLLIAFAGDIPTNQSAINEWPLYISIPIAIIIAPITEELMFRGFMKKFIKNNTLFLIISSLVFGALHVTLADSIYQFLFIVPYSILGFAFTLNYIKTKNIVSNIFLHSTWNSLATIALVITKLL